MPKKGFIDRKQAKHYHVVHRSQRDPLINDTDASSRVLQEVVPGNLIKHKTPEELERIRAKPKKMTQDEIDQRVGQAALHGIFFDDAEYDYMQHLKPMGAPDAVFLEAPTARKEKTKQQGIKGLQLRDEIEEEKQQQSTGLFDDVNSKKNPNLFELPTDVLPSSVEVNTKLMGQTGLEGGLQPDMDPRLREVLEALEDEEYVEDDLDESFFDNLNDEAAEPYNPDEDEYYDDEEEEYEYEDIEEDGPVDPENYDWQTAFNKFKRNQKRGGSDDEFDDDDFDIRSKGTGFSVSSSAMHRNVQLRTLDDRFDRIEEEYMNDDDEEEGHEFDGDISKERADFESILDDFLANYEVVGNKIAPKLEGEDSVQKLDTIRKALDRINIKEEDEEEAAKKEKKQRSAKEKLDDPWARPEQRKKATWDCQSVLSTYSNLENHPQLISDRGPKKKISIDPKTGMPILVEVDSKKQRNKYAKYKSRHGDDNDDEDANDDDSEEEEEEEEDRPNLGERRSKAETKEEKKLRKQAIKDAKKNRREEKKSTKAAFKNEENKQRHTIDQQRKAKGVTHII